MTAPIPAGAEVPPDPGGLDRSEQAARFIDLTRQLAAAHAEPHEPDHDPSAESLTDPPPPPPQSESPERD